MPGKDQYTKKGPLFGNNRSHALNRTNRKYFGRGRGNRKSFGFCRAFKKRLKRRVLRH